MLIHGIYSLVSADDVYNLETNRYLNFNVEEFENQTSNLEIKFHIPESKIAVYQGMDYIVLV